ncbi:MAG: ATP-binding protein [Nanoarchaeota archaeon]|nr:ATP-binding protein [Nanoarchaeota archaeon]
MKFYDRENEIRILNAIKKDFRIAIIGRRRIGKTRLVEHFYKDSGITFFIPAEKAEKEIISDWVSEYSSLPIPRVDNFKEFFEFVFIHLKDRVIFLDEIQNSLKVNKSFVFDLQRLIDKYKPKLVVSGSLISTMKKIIEDNKSPLYGRFDFIIKLEELDFKTVFNMCKDFGLSFEDSLRLFAIFGGIPKYYELIEKIKKFSFEDFVLDMFIKYPRPLYEEIRTILKEEFGSEYKTFFSILSSISQGKNRLSEIANFIGKKQTEITKYLAMLRDDFEVIERNIPVLFGKKKGVYAIKNNIFSFWFNTIWRYNQLLETRQENKLAKLIPLSLNEHVSLRFEKIVIELINFEIIKLPFSTEKLGKQWGKFEGEKGKNTYEIDIVALNIKTKEILFAECKWQENVNAKKVLIELKQKASYIKWNKDKRKEYYAIFAKSFKKKIKEKNVFLCDLKDLEKLLK